MKVSSKSSLFVLRLFVEAFRLPARAVTLYQKMEKLTTYTTLLIGKKRIVRCFISTEGI